MSNENEFNIEWLRKNALFLCDRCVEYSEESQCRRAEDMKLLDGATLCEDCYDTLAWRENLDDWEDLENFDPFSGLVEHHKE